MDLQRVAIVENVRETASVWRLCLEWDALARGPRSARFAMVGLPEPTPHLLPRPFSISDAWRDEEGRARCDFLYKPIGRVTEALTRLRAGEEVRVTGLCGNGFPAPPRGHRPVLLAGGIGNAPFAYQVRELVEQGQDPREIVLFLAGRGTEDVWIQPRVRELGVRVLEVTEDGSLGFKGRITDALLAHLDELGPCELYACGPTPMLHALGELAKAHDLRCHLAVEEHMACGYGVCNACVVERDEPGTAPGEGPYLKVCMEGPVFECREIRL